MKKITAIFCAIVFCISCMALQGCGADNAGAGLGAGKALDASDLSINDFAWETIQSKYNGEDCYVFSLTNNSEYDVIAVEFTYKVRDDVSDSDLEVYNDFMNDHEGYIEETDSPRDVILRGSKDVLVAQGEELTGLRFTVGFKKWAWYDYPTKEQFELMEPKEMQLGVVGNDGVIYIAYYDFENDAWMLDENALPVDVWSGKEIANKVSRPAEQHHIVITDEEDKFKVCSYGVTVDEYSQYIESVKESGFVEESSSPSSFNGKSADGYAVQLWYYREDERLNITIGKEL